MAEDNSKYVPDQEFLDSLNVKNIVKENKENWVKTKDKIDLFKSLPESDDEIELEIINTLKELMAQNREVLEDLIVKIETGGDVFFSDAYSKVSKSQSDALKMYIDLLNAKKRNQNSVEVTKMNIASKEKLFDKSREDNRQVNTGNVLMTATRDAAVKFLMQQVKEAEAAKEKEEVAAKATVVENIPSEEKNRNE